MAGQHIVAASLIASLAVAMQMTTLDAIVSAALRKRRVACRGVVLAASRVALGLLFQELHASSGSAELHPVLRLAYFVAML